MGTQALAELTWVVRVGLAVVGVGLVGFFGLLVLGLAKAAGRADRQMERWREDD